MEYFKTHTGWQCCDFYLGSSHNASSVTTAQEHLHITCLLRAGTPTIWDPVPEYFKMPQKLILLSLLHLLDFFISCEANLEYHFQALFGYFFFDFQHKLYIAMVKINLHEELLTSFSFFYRLGMMNNLPLGQDKKSQLLNCLYCYKNETNQSVILLLCSHVLGFLIRKKLKHAYDAFRTELVFFLQVFYIPKLSL